MALIMRIVFVLCLFAIPAAAAPCDGDEVKIVQETELGKMKLEGFYALFKQGFEKVSAPKKAYVEIVLYECPYDQNLEVRYRPPVFGWLTIPHYTVDLPLWVFRRFTPEELRFEGAAAACMISGIEDRNRDGDNSGRLTRDEYHHIRARGEFCAAQLVGSPEAKRWFSRIVPPNTVTALQSIP
jgi:hypothetical protein